MCDECKKKEDIKPGTVVRFKATVEGIILGPAVFREEHHLIEVTHVNGAELEVDGIHGSGWLVVPDAYGVVVEP